MKGSKFNRAGRNSNCETSEPSSSLISHITIVKEICGKYSRGGKKWKKWLYPES